MLIVVSLSYKSYVSFRNSCTIPEMQATIALRSNGMEQLSTEALQVVEDKDVKYVGSTKINRNIASQDDAVPMELSAFPTHSEHSFVSQRKQENTDLRTCLR